MAQVNEDQIREAAEKLFASIDLNQNGWLEQDEVREFSRQMLNKVMPNQPFDEAKFLETFR